MRPHSLLLNEWPTIPRTNTTPIGTPVFTSGADDIRLIFGYLRVAQSSPETQAITGLTKSGHLGGAEREARSRHEPTTTHAVVASVIRCATLLRAGTVSEPAPDASLAVGLSSLVLASRRGASTRS
jgi:hypothetical protein